MNNSITHLLEADHRKIEDLYNQLNSARTRNSYDCEECEKLFLELKATVIAHAKAEEMALYSLFADADEKEEKDLKKNSLEGYEEHQIIDRLLDDMDDIEISDDQWLAKLTVVTELLEHHVREEEKEFLPLVQRVLEPEELEDLGALYVQQQKEIYKIESAQSPSTFYEESAFQF